MGKRSDEEIKKIKDVIFEISKIDSIIKPTGDFKTTKIMKILKENYNLDISRPTLIKILKSIPTTVTSGELDETIKWYDDEIIAWKQKSIDAKTYRDKKIATEAIDKLMIGRERLLMMRKESQQSKYIVRFGTPEEIKQNDNKEKKEPFFKVGNGQSTIPIEDGDKDG